MSAQRSSLVKRSPRGLLFKDAVLDELADVGNVAQFVSFEPGAELAQRYSRIHGFERNHRFDSSALAVESLLSRSTDHSVNIRSFDPKQPRSHDFVYGLRSTEEALARLRPIAAGGLFTIVNETVDVKDGGVSGVVFGNIIEFAPGDTPRAVEKPGTVAFTRDTGLEVLRLVYGFEPKLDYALEERVEFSLHPSRRGVRKDHTIVWELERIGQPYVFRQLRWPNHFSRLIGDKTFGLIVAATIGLHVPGTTVIPRGLPPFHFGTPTHTGEIWLRTCPQEPMPGRFTTTRGWVDPFDLLRKEDETGAALSSVLAQEGVDALFSGAAISDSNGLPVIEGVAGAGDKFMLGQQAPQALPADLANKVARVFARATENVGPVSLEWVFDGRKVWTLQLHQTVGVGRGSLIYPGSPSIEHRFVVTDGLEALRTLAAAIKGGDEGIVLVGDVGVTSHFGDVLRKAKIPSRIEGPEFKDGSHSSRRPVSKATTS